MPSRSSVCRTDESGRAYAGSQRQIQACVNERTLELSTAVADALRSYDVQAEDLRWVSPLASEKYSEYRDGDFLERIGGAHLAIQLHQFWPRKGPCWDALATLPGGGCVLVEAKSHVPEIYGGGCKAKADTSLSLIHSSCDRTKAWLGAKADANWLGHLYQSANRLAYLYFLREVAKLNAFLVNVYFIADPHSPTIRQEWDAAIKGLNGQLGVSNSIPYSASVFLNAV